jgi:formylglycine-generating enzyme required for sulfatase activity/streptogramin lyase
MWFLETGVEKIGRIDGRPPYHLEEFTVPASLDGSRDLAVGRDGALWFTESRKIARVDPRPPHLMTEFAVPSGRDPVSLAVDADDGVWFTTAFSGFGRIRPGTPREVEEFDLAAADAGFSRIVYGRDGNLWFATHKSNRMIRVQREYPHTVTEIPLRVPGSAVTDLTFRSAGDLWFVAGAGNYVGRMWPSEPFELDMYPLDSPPSTPQQLVFGSDGMLWLTDPGRNRILRLVVPEPGTEFQSARARIGTAAERGIKWYTPNRPSPAKGSIGIHTDAEVVLFVDSERLTQLRANSNEIIPLSVGAHIVSARGVNTGRTWGKAVEVVVGQHVQMMIEGLGVPESAADSFVPALPRFRFVPVPPGEFFMGSEEGSADEGPRHRVRITRRFEMGRCEVTQDEWTLVIGKNPSAFEFRGGDLPVVNVSWDDTEEFLRRLEMLDPTHRYRLPTEAEWEYACRAGASADPANLEDYAWFGDKAFFTTHPVGTKRPNGWGLHDMYGNVAEWCRDWYDRFYYSRSIDVDPPGPSNGSDRVVRGGDYRMRANAFRATERRAWSPTTRANGLGFRLVRSAP